MIVTSTILKLFSRVLHAKCRGQSKVAFALIFLLGLALLALTIYVEHLFVKAGICPGE